MRSKIDHKDHVTNKGQSVHVHHGVSTVQFPTNEPIFQAQSYEAYMNRNLDSATKSIHVNASAMTNLLSQQQIYHGSILPINYLCTINFRMKT